MKKYQLDGAGRFVPAGFYAWRLKGDGAKIVGLITGKAAFVDSKDLKPGTFRKITVADLPEPGDAHPSFGKMSPRPEGAMPQVPAGIQSGAVRA